MDSLWNVFKNVKNHDTIRLSALYDMSWEIVYDNPDSSLILGEMIKNLSQSKKIRKWESKAFNIKGAAYQIKNEYLKAVNAYQSSLKILEELGNNEGAAGAYSNIGSIYIYLGDFQKALEYEVKSYKTFEMVGNKRGMASVSNNLGIIYNNLADKGKALESNQMSLKLYEELGDKNGIAASLGNIGNIYISQGKFDEALKYQLKCISISEEIGSKEVVANAYRSLAEIYSGQKNYPKAISYLYKSVKIATEEKNIKSKQEAVFSLSKVYKKMKRADSALKYFTVYVELKDSMRKENFQEEMMKNELQFEYRKKAQADSVENARIKEVQEAQILAKNSQIDRQKTQEWALIIGLGLVMLFGLVIYNRFRITTRQKALIEIKNKETEVQKGIIEEKQKEILASINYAKRLQEAILPSQNLIKEYLPDSFILYKPKDIVAGDFYWMEVVQERKKGAKKSDEDDITGNELILFAAADCTGHGVPGAMVSVVCSNALNRTVKEFRITEPGKILDKVRELVVETFEKSGSNVKDGMDISLCAFNKRTMNLQWAGANNPLWILRGNEMMDVKPNKQPIGKTHKPVPFTNHEIQLQKNDTLYIFTDGFADQFGGPKGKKYMYKPFSDLLIANGTRSMEEQKQALYDSFSNWKGSLQQIDDILVMGIRV